MTTNTYVKPLGLEYFEKSAVTVGANFRSGGAAAVPTTVHYRVDNLTTKTNIVDWTSVTPAASVSISITPAQNTITSNCNPWERRQVTFAADKDTATETRDIVEYKLMNIGGFDE